MARAYPRAARGTSSIGRPRIWRTPSRGDAAARQSPTCGRSTTAAAWGSSRRSRARSARVGRRPSTAVTARTGRSPTPPTSCAARPARITESAVFRHTRTSTARPVKTPRSVPPNATATVVVPTPPPTPATVGPSGRWARDGKWSGIGSPGSACGDDQQDAITSRPGRSPARRSLRGTVGHGKRHPRRWGFDYERGDSNPFPTESTGPQPAGRMTLRKSGSTSRFGALTAPVMVAAMRRA